MKYMYLSCNIKQATFHQLIVFWICMSEVNFLPLDNKYNQKSLVLETCRYGFHIYVIVSQWNKNTFLNLLKVLAITFSSFLIKFRNLRNNYMYRHSNYKNETERMFAILSQRRVQLRATWTSTVWFQFVCWIYRKLVHLMTNVNMNWN